jgi:hypothetical protein
VLFIVSRDFDALGIEPVVILSCPAVEQLASASARSAAEAPRRRKILNEDAAETAGMTLIPEFL